MSIFLASGSACAGRHISPGSFARYLPKIVRSYAMDAAETPKSGAAPPVEEAVRRFIEEMKAAATERF